jgi:hypothetical protein
LSKAEHELFMVASFASTGEPNTVAQEFFETLTTKLRFW